MSAGCGVFCGVCKHYLSKSIKESKEKERELSNAPSYYPDCTNSSNPPKFPRKAFMKGHIAH